MMNQVEQDTYRLMLNDPELIKRVKAISKAVREKYSKGFLVAYVIGFNHGITATEDYIRTMEVLEKEPVEGQKN